MIQGKIMRWIDKPQQSRKCWYILCTSGLNLEKSSCSHQARRFLEIFGGVQLNNQNFFGKISRILFAQLVIVDFVCIVRLYVAIAHLMQFLFFLVLSRLENKRTVFWKRKNKTHRGQKWVGGGERVSRDI